MAGQSLIVRVGGNLDDLKRALAEGKVIVENTSSSMDKLASKLGGSKAIQEAEKWAGAIAKIGGATKLVASDQEAANRVFERAVQYYKAAGKEGDEAATKIQKLAEATRKVPPAIEQVVQKQNNWAASLGKVNGLLGMFGVGLSVGAVVAFGKALLDTSDQLVRLSDKTGIGIEGIQKLQYIAEQSGNSLEQVTSAVSMLQKRLAGGDDSAEGALKRLGISADQFFALTPDQQFMAIAREVGKVEDPMQRVKVATDLFGRAGAEVLPSLIANVDELADAAPKMSEKAVRAFDDVGDSIARMWAKTKAGGGETLGNMIDGYGRLFEAAQAAASMDFGKAGDALFDLQTDLPKVAGSADGWRKAATAAALGADAFGVSIEKADKIIADMSKTQAKAWAEADRHAEALQKLTDQFTGKGLLENAQNYAATLERLGGTSRLTTTEQDTFRKAFEAVVEKYQRMGPEGEKVVRHFQDLAATIPLAATSLRIVAGQVQDLSDKVPSLTSRSEGLRNIMAGLTEDGLLPVNKSFAGLIEQAPQVENGAQRVGEALLIAFENSRLKQAIDGIAGSMSNAFAALITRAAGFKDAFLTMWKDIQRQIAGILDDILNYYIRRFIGGLLGATGQGGGLLGKILGSGVMSAIGSSAASAATNALAPIAASNLASLAGGGNTLASLGGGGASTAGLTAALAGGAAVGGSGLLMGMLGKALAGGAGWQAGAIGAAGGAGTGALVGTFVFPGVGTAVGAGIGALVGAVSGLFGKSAGKKAGEAADKQIGDIQGELLNLYGSLDNISALGKQVGVDLAGAWGDKNAAGLQHFAQLTKQFTDQLERNKKIQEGIAAIGPGGLMSPALMAQIASQQGAMTDETRAAIGQFMQGQTSQGIGAIQAIAGGTFTSQAGAAGIGAGVLALVEQMREQGASMTQIIAALGPTIDTLREKFEKAGLSGGQAFRELSDQMGYMSDEGVAPLLASAQGVTDLMTTLANLGRLDADTFKGLAAQVSATAAELEAQGKGGEAMYQALQPQLQRIWELQQQFGFEVDESTQKMIDEAVASGKVGDQFRPATDRMITAINNLITRLGVFIDSIIGLPGQAGTAASGVKDKFSGLDIPPIKVPYVFEPRGTFPGGEGFEVEPEPMARGGIVTRPTYALIGEAGPEAVIPLDRVGAVDAAASAAAMGGTVNVDATFIGVVKERWIKEEVMPGILAILRKGGGTLTDWRVALGTN